MAEEVSIGIEDIVAAQMVECVPPDPPDVLQVEVQEVIPVEDAKE